ncbi:hypothetical protein QTH97_32550 [Variovorax sp. J22R24]|uniref:hypothetical protein n=1 Tax=Variovorax gracilis TaxID=3053502 RepID=UPI002574C2AB|nr:hypothetical protein [Variovorax sp. J22R24]MDM0109689.1 hypothetical protein [Variovorax sp. J22R24]
MRSAVYYSLMLLLGFAWYQFGQNPLRKGYREENGRLTQGIVGPVGLLVTAVVACGLLFALLRALFRGEVSCLGRGCTMQIYTLAAHAGEYWANVFYLAWMVLGLGYAMYVTSKIWFRV